MKNLQQKAFSLIEISIAMGIIAILASAIVPIGIRGVQIKAGEKTALEMLMIQDASRNYYIDHNSWPADVATLQAQDYLNKNWLAANPWHNPYQIFNNTLGLTVSSIVPVQWVALVASHLPASTINNGTVNSTITSLGSVGVASGVIVAWSGSISTIPKGWVLCDGNNGAPDLRDKFVVGAQQDVNGLAESNLMGALLQTGGSVTHNHSGVTGAHVLTVTEIPRHHHGYLATPWTGARYDGHSSPLMTSQVQGQTDDTGGDQAHTHTISADYNVPPFYALAFIMKL
ncbi:MAG: prepilin-type N-terminal cleavage/methylation domain-containing protein [Candidatus Omnitrophica bacterium]|nr:prepilin-type N-terminal cleavage/methylation domain-containing protein [Candidatus Omnitrophota bacterium]